MNSPDPLFAEVAGALGDSLVGATQLTGGSSADVWRLDLDGVMDTRSVVFRRHKPRTAGKPQRAARNTRKEYQLLGELAARNFPVPAPLLLDTESRFLVTEFVDGTAEVEPHRVDAALDQMADLLVRVHGLDVDSLAAPDLGPLENPCDELAQFLPDTASSHELRQLLDGGRIEMRRNSDALVHGDYWPGNVLWANGQLAALIDWEDAAVGDPLADLAGARVELLCAYGEPAMRRFTDRYLQASSLDTQSLPLWEYYVSAAALYFMDRWGLEPAEELRRRTQTTAFFERAEAHVLERYR